MRCAARIAGHYYLLFSLALKPCRTKPGLGRGWLRPDQLELADFRRDFQSLFGRPGGLDNGSASLDKCEVDGDACPGTVNDNRRLPQAAPSNAQQLLIAQSPRQIWISVQGGTDAAELAIQLGADRPQDSQNDDADQPGDQAVFDRRSATVIAEKSLQLQHHRRNLTQRLKLRKSRS